MSVHSGAPSAAGLEDSDDDFKYEEVEVVSEEEGDEFSEDLDSALRQIQALNTKSTPSSKKGAAPAPPAGDVTRHPEVIDDFIRNFFVRHGLVRTGEMFETEWYELKAAGKLDVTLGVVPDVYLRNAELEEALAALNAEVRRAQEVAGKAGVTWDKFRKERDFHRMHHKRVAQEKDKLLLDLRNLKAHYKKYEPTILDLKRKYEDAMKEKSLTAISRDKLAAKVASLEAQLKAAQAAATSERKDSGVMSPGGDTLASKPRTSAHATWPAAPRSNPRADKATEPTEINRYSLQKTVKCHLMSVANVALHPTKPVMVTASDDKTWKMWHMPGGDLIMCGEGHKDWVAGVDFHPGGASLASSSGDGTVKLWDFEKQRCVHTFTDHKKAVWSVRHHDAGEWLASCSLDHSVRLWDLVAAKSRQILRGHVDSVNDCAWQHYTNNLCTASSDKTVSMWDCRSGLCTQSFYGHRNSCNSVAVNLQGTTIASTDADGCVKLWDVRMLAEISTLETGKYPANKCAFDPSGQIIVIACDDSKIKAFNVATGEAVGELIGHEDAAQAVAIDPAGHYMVSCGSDCTFRLWQ